MKSNALPLDQRRAILCRLRGDFLGLDTVAPVFTLDGRTRPARRVYLDTTATSLMPRFVYEMVGDYLCTSNANSHTRAHLAGRTTTQEIEYVRRAIGDFVGYDSARDVVLFTGNGATGAVNLLAAALFPPSVSLLFKRADSGGAMRECMDRYRAVLCAEQPPLEELLRRDLVVVTKMEHHSNMLPWIQAVGRTRVRFVDLTSDGALDLDHLREILAREGSRVRIVAVTGVSNVTGIINPVHEIARMAHAAGAEIVVDAAQMAPHLPVRMHRPVQPEADLDYVVLSGHKLYAPGSRGALVGRASPFVLNESVGDVGGGMVEYVSLEDTKFKQEITAREEAGTPNIPGTLALGAIVRLLGTIGMDLIAQEEQALVPEALGRLASIPGVVVYGNPDPRQVPRAGVIAFNVEGIPHGLVAAVLSDYFNVDVRNECFCAHPYVKEQLRVPREVEQRYIAEILEGDRRHVPGMVRASLGLYSTHEDLVALEEAVRFVVEHARELRERYEQVRDGDYVHRPPLCRRSPFSIEAAVQRFAAS